jgi:GLPGLI family protein
MRNILHCLFIMLFTTALLNAQQFEGIATYKTDRKIDLKMDGEGIDDAMQEQMAAMLRKQFQKEYELTFTPNESIYEEVEGLETPAPQNANGLSFVVSGGDDVLYRNIKDNTYTNQTEIMGKEFLIQDSLQKPDWILEKETKNIGEYTCFKATKSREVFEQQMTSESDSLVKTTKLITTTAWYTLAIPVPHGPGEFYGLPGLVLQVEDGDLTILCSKIVLNPQEKINIEVPKSGKKVSQAQFDEIQEKKSAEMMERFQTDGRKKGKGDTFRIKIGG